MKKQSVIEHLNESMMSNGIDFVLDGTTMDQIAVDVSRVADNKITGAINCLKNGLGIKINSTQKELIRKYFIGYPVELPVDVKEYAPELTELDYEEAYRLIGEGFKRKESIMTESLIARVKKNFLHEYSDNVDDYLKYIQELQVGKKQLMVIHVDADAGYSTDNIAEIVKQKYDELSNYHRAIVIFQDGQASTDWGQISEVALFMEQFRKEKGFNVFEKKNKAQRIDEIKSFIANSKNVNSTDVIEAAAEKFYDGVAYGFQFEDLFISTNGKTKVLVMQKVELDETVRKCPSCVMSIVRGNSYSRILYKSFECQNPSCPSRSKIGRGKRYDLFGAKRQVMLERNSGLDGIDDRTYSAFRRDIIDEDDISIQRLIMLYSWSGDEVEVINTEFDLKEYNERGIQCTKVSEFNENGLFSALDFVKLFTEVSRSLVFPREYDLKSTTEIGNSYGFNGNSTDLIPFIDEFSGISQFGAAITSPPYYNAREYSQWSNMLCYLVDMMTNAKSVHDRLADRGTYIYNIGDVVGQDNVHVQSNMSKRRQMLGFYSVVIFEIVGYKTVTNIVWDKGEVQSKRNSTSNHLSGYVKPVNAYEHCFVFSKASDEVVQPTVVKEIDTVRKINSKGENILGHTAPYPPEIAELIIPFVNDKEEYVVDPFLGSGTTIIAMREAGYSAVGFELDKTYYDLAMKRIKDVNQTLFSLLENH